MYIICIYIYICMYIVWYRDSGQFDHNLTSWLHWTDWSWIGVFFNGGPKSSGQRMVGITQIPFGNLTMGYHGISTVHHLPFFQNLRCFPAQKILSIIIHYHLQGLFIRRSQALTRPIDMASEMKCQPRTKREETNHRRNFSGKTYGNHMEVTSARWLCHYGSIWIDMDRWFHMT